MKKLFFLACLILTGVMAYAQQSKKVAILEVVDRESKLSYSDKLMLRSNLARAVTNIDGYEAYTRTDIDAVLQEHDFQRSGNVRDDDIKKIGEMTGAAYILQTEGSITRDNNIYVVAQIINVETLQIEVTENKSISTKSDVEMLRGCRALASSMFGILAGVSTSTNTFLNLFKGKPKTPEEQRADSIAAVRKAERAASVAAAKEQQRLDEQRIKQERTEAEAKVRRERAEAEAKVRREREAAEEAARLESEHKKSEEAERAKYYISKLNNKEYMYMNKIMTTKEYENFLKNSCPEAYSQYKSGKGLIGAGWGCFAPGLVIAAGSGVCMLIGLDPVICNGVASIGGALTVASIPILSVGYVKRDKALETYNSKCASSDIVPLTLNMTAGQNGLGLAINF